MEEKIAKKLVEQIKVDLINQKIWKEDSLQKFLNYDFEAEFATKDKSLVELKNQFFTTKADDDFVNLVLALKNATVFVPVNVKMSDEDEKWIQQSLEHGEIKVGNQIQLKNDLHLVPDKIQSKNDGTLHIPVFSEESEIPKDCAKNFSIISVKFTDCVNLAKNIENVESILSLTHSHSHSKLRMNLQTRFCRKFRLP